MTVARENRTGDELIDQAEEAEDERGGAHEERAANLFDIRRIIGGLFLLYGLVLTVLGFGASDADLRRADGLNVNLAVGIVLLIVASLFIAWALLRPLGRELETAEAEADDAHGERRFHKDERSAARPARVPETR
ncbi:MAG: hypothetical protein V7607_4790 [Solirubrobacteraceae bacterium]